MSNIEGLLVIETIEQQQALERVSLEPSPVPEEEQETDGLLCGPKPVVPKGVPVFLAVLCLFELSAISTAASSLDLYYNFVCSHFGIDQESCLRNEQASKIVAGFVGINTSIVSAFSLVVTSVLTVASDMFGRKPMLVMAMAANCLSLVTSVYIFFHMSTERTYWVMLVPSIVDGLGGTTNLIGLLSVAYITDMIQDGDLRTRLLAISSGFSMASVAAGPVLGSWIINHYGLQPLYIAAVIGVGASTVLAMIFLRESLSSAQRRRNSDAGPGIKRAARIVAFDHIGDSRLKHNARILLVCALIVMGYNSCFWSVLILYPKLRFGWAAVESGYLLSSMFATRTFCYLVGFPLLYKLLAKRFAVHSDQVDKVDRTLMVLTLIIAVLGSLALGWSRTGGEYFASGIFDSCTTMGAPVFTSALTKHIPAPEMGTFMAAFNVILSMVAIFAPSLIMQLYSVTLQWRPSVTFEFTAGVFAFVLALSLSLRLD